MMERADSGQKLYTRMRLWEFPDQYVIEPTDGSSGSSLAVSRKDGSMKLIGSLFVSVDSLLHLFALCFAYHVHQYGSIFDFCVFFVLLFADEVPECSTLRVPRIFTIFGVVGMLRLLAGM